MAVTTEDKIQQTAVHQAGKKSSSSDAGYPIRRVAVLGAGTMGARIAAHVANAGFPVVLLDMVPEGATQRNVLALQAVEALKKSKPAAFVSNSLAANITTGNFSDDLGLSKPSPRKWRSNERCSLRYCPIFEQTPSSRPTPVASPSRASRKSFLQNFAAAGSARTSSIHPATCDW
jgi:hypothetical protein